MDKSDKELKAKENRRASQRSMVLIIEELQKQVQSLNDDLHSGNTPPLKKIERYLNAKYDFRNNPILSRTEYKLKEESYYQLLDDRAFYSIFRNLNLNNLKCSTNLVKSILNSDFIESINPFTEYFDSLPAWDQQHDYIDQLASTIKTTNQSFWKEALKKWLVATVACAIRPDVVNHEVLVLCGEQGIGKTAWLNKLLPQSLKGYLFVGTVNPNNKDTLICLSENLLINLDELENLNKSELGNLKSLITLDKIRLRRAYGQFTENFSRRASFMGSVNDAEFLSDTTGNRRYLCFTVEQVNYEHGINLDDVYAQAHFLLNTYRDQHGEQFRYWFNREDIKQIEKNNDAYLRVSVEEELLFKYFDLPANVGEEQLYTVAEIIKYINKAEENRVIDNTSQRRIGQVLNKYGFKRKSVANQKPYKVKLQGLQKKDAQNVQAASNQDVEPTFTTFEDFKLGDMFKLVLHSQNEGGCYFIDIKLGNQGMEVLRYQAIKDDGTLLMDAETERLLCDKVNNQIDMLNDTEIRQKMDKVFVITSDYNRDIIHEDVEENPYSNITSLDEIPGGVEFGLILQSTRSLKYVFHIITKSGKRMAIACNIFDESGKLIDKPKAKEVLWGLIDQQIDFITDEAIRSEMPNVMVVPINPGYTPNKES